MKNLVAVITLVLSSISLGGQKEKEEAMGAALCLFAVLDNLSDQNQPASPEVVAHMETWIRIVSESLSSNTLSNRISTSEVEEMRRVAMIERNRVRKEDGLPEAYDWFQKVMESVKLVHWDYQQKGWARPNIGWLTPFRRVSEVLKAEAAWQHIIIHGERQGKQCLPILDSVRKVRVDYEKQRTKPGSIGWTENNIMIKLMTRIPTLKEIEAKRKKLAQSPALKPFRTLKEGTPTKPAPKPAPKLKAPAPPELRHPADPSTIA